MNKKQLALTFCIALSALCSTLKTSAQSYIGITGGLSLPSGNFAKDDYSDPKSGFAGSGGNIGLTGVYFIKKSHFGIAALFSYQGFGHKGAQSLADGFKEDFGIDSSTVDIKGSNHAINVLIGPYYSIPVAGHFMIDVRALGGITSAHLAGYLVHIEDQTGNEFGQKEASATGFGWQIGVAPRYNFSQHIGLMLNLDYFSSKPTFNIDNDNRQNVAGRRISTYNEPLQGINTNLTLCWMF